MPAHPFVALRIHTGRRLDRKGNVLRSAETGGGTLITAILLIFLAIVFPPAVAMLRGTLRQTAISLILTLLGWIPGVIYAFWILAHRPALRSPAGLEEYPV